MEMTETDRIEQLKKINHAGMSQERIAREIGVSLSTVQKWLAGQFAPSLLAEKSIDAFIYKNLSKIQKKK